MNDLQNSCVHLHLCKYMWATQESHKQNLCSLEMTIGCCLRITRIRKGRSQHLLVWIERVDNACCSIHFGLQIRTRCTRKLRQSNWVVCLSLIGGRSEFVGIDYVVLDPEWSSLTLLILQFPIYNIVGLQCPNFKKVSQGTAHTWPSHVIIYLALLQLLTWRSVFLQSFVFPRNLARHSLLGNSLLSM